MGSLGVRKIMKFQFRFATKGTPWQVVVDAKTREDAQKHIDTMITAHKDSLNALGFQKGDVTPMPVHTFGDWIAAQKKTFGV